MVVTCQTLISADIRENCGLRLREEGKMSDPIRDGTEDDGDSSSSSSSSMGHKSNNSYLVELNLIMLLCASTSSSSPGECSDSERIDQKKDVSGRDSEARSSTSSRLIGYRNRERVGLQPVAQRRSSFQMKTRDIRHSRKM